MKQVYSAQHPPEAHFLRGLLEADEISSEVHGEALWGARGELPFSETAPTVWILNDADFDRALALVATYEAGKGPGVNGPDWSCPQCGQRVEAPFTSCWKCGAEQPQYS
jgi:hypothetical protein